MSQQGLADLMKSEQHQSHQHNSGGMPLSNGIGNGNKPNSLQEEFKALFPSANVSFDGKWHTLAKTLVKPGPIHIDQLGSHTYSAMDVSG